MPDHTDDNLIRFGVSMPEGLLEQFDALIETKGYTNRSEAIRDLVRDRLIEARTEKDNGAVVGALVLVYDHHTRTLSDRMTEIQHDAGDVVISTMHVHLTHHDCLEVLALKGANQNVRALANSLLSLKGVKHGKLLLTGSTENHA